MNWDAAPPFGRKGTIQKTLQRLYEICPQHARVLETGTIRSEGLLVGDGWSTVAWGWFCSQTDGKLWTVDINGDFMKTSRWATAPYAPWIEYVVSDSVAFIRQWNTEANGKIDLFYQDSFDYDNPPVSEAHHLSEAQAALPYLADRCLVLFDDTDIRNGTQITGKGATAIPFYWEHGFKTEWTDGEWNHGGQVLLSRGLR